MCLAIPGKIVEVLEERENLAMVDIGGVRRKIDVGLLDKGSAQVGDWVLIHVGFAMSKISEHDAEEQMEMLAMLGESQAALEDVEADGVHESDVNAKPGDG